MSGFLANLIRRSAGLTPTIRSRPVDAVPDVDSASREQERVGGEATTLDRAAPPATAAIEPRPPAMAAHTPADVPAPPVVSQPLAAIAAPLIQRFVQPAMPAPIAASGGSIQPAGSVPVDAPSRATEPARGDETPISSPAPRTSRLLLSEPAIAVHAAPAMQPVPQEGGAIARPDTPMTPEPRAIDLVMNPPPVEITAETGRAAIADADPSPILQLSLPAQPVAETVVVPERVVHVRIGAIEIHGAPSPAFAPAAAPSLPAQLVSSTESGFDRYARLRSYAAWER